MDRNGKDCKVYCKCFFPKRKEAKGMAQRSMFQKTTGKLSLLGCDQEEEELGSCFSLRDTFLSFECRV